MPDKQRLKTVNATLRGLACRKVSPSQRRVLTVKAPTSGRAMSPCEVDARQGRSAAEQQDLLKVD